MRVIFMYFLISLAACTTAVPNKTYELKTQITASAGSSMFAWTAANGVTKEFIFMGHEGPLVKMRYREYRTGESRDLINKELVFTVAENYSADKEIHALTLIVYERLEVRILSLDNQVITYQIVSD